MAETLAEAWQTCESGGAMVKLCGAMLWFNQCKMGTEGWPTAREILSVLCECAETTFRYLPSYETGPQECVRLSRLWAEGKATIAEVAAAIYTAKPEIARSRIVWTNAKYRDFLKRLRDPHAFPGASAAARSAYDIANATISADEGGSCKFCCYANGAIGMAASAHGPTRAEAPASPALTERRISMEKEFADIVRSKLHPEGLESYRVTPMLPKPITLDEGIGCDLCLLRKDYLPGVEDWKFRTFSEFNAHVKAKHEQHGH
jgi:hypothetical protein